MSRALFLTGAITRAAKATVVARQPLMSRIGASEWWKVDDRVNY